MEQGRFPLKTPLRWHGHLRDEPTRLPWGYGYEIELSGVAFEDALRGWRDVTRDAAHEPRAIQFRIDLRSLTQWFSTRLPQWLRQPTGEVLASGLSLTFRAWELLVVTLALQAGMLPLMARDFHRIPLSAPLVNLAAVPLTGVIVPLGLLTLACGLILPAAGKLFTAPLAWLTALLLHIVRWFAHFPLWSHRIPGPPFWLILLFFATAILIAAEMRLKPPLRKTMVWGLCVVFMACALTIAVSGISEAGCCRGDARASGSSGRADCNPG